MMKQAGRYDRACAGIRALCDACADAVEQGRTTVVDGCRELCSPRCCAALVTLVMS